jgi:hypothetical protein
LRAIIFGYKHEWYKNELINYLDVFEKTNPNRKNTAQENQMKVVAFLAIPLVTIAFTEAGYTHALSTANVKECDKYTDNLSPKKDWNRYLSCGGSCKGWPDPKHMKPAPYVKKCFNACLDLSQKGYNIYVAFTEGKITANPKHFFDLIEEMGINKAYKTIMKTTRVIGEPVPMDPTKIKDYQLVQTNILHWKCPLDKVMKETLSSF